MVLVIGPSRVGKTTLVRMLEEQLLAKGKALMASDPSFIPFASILAAEPGTSRFEWAEYYRWSCAPSMIRLWMARLRGYAPGSCAKRRKPRYLSASLSRSLLMKPIIWRAAASGSRLQSQLNHLKHFENTTGASHVLVGTYEMRPFRKANAQLACRSVYVHFPRYDATNDKVPRCFKVSCGRCSDNSRSRKNPLLDHWEFLYARSIGCSGLLKMHLNRR